jgi:lipopolysaccharide/colanic/teichoic acid biosynthesis glycosyltransferase
MSIPMNSAGAAVRIKRLIDILVAAAGLILLSPLLAALSLLVLAKLGRPVFFRQQRPGLHGVPFMLVKLRTMLDATDGNGRALPDCERLTGFGQWLRSTSLDELPELWNVLKGDMSLVGPRPLLMHYLPLYSAEEARRHDVRPGLTGWAQVNGRNAISWPEKFRHDVWYVDHWSLALDLRILAASVASVLGRRGIAAADAATMPEFTGSSGQSSGEPESGPDRPSKD